VQNVVGQKDWDIFCVEGTPEPCGVVIFGASGDLTRRKLIPALFSLFERGLLPPEFFLLGYARSPLTDEAFREAVVASVKRAVPGMSDSVVDGFAEHCYYQPGNYQDDRLFDALGDRLSVLSAKHGTMGNVLFYVSTPPVVYLDIVSGLSRTGLVDEPGSGGAWRRVVLEKPFGHDLESARKLDCELQGLLSESQMYRIDHYLGKETVQNLFVLRFANSIFEPLWNREHIDHIQISVAERVGLEGRAGYYEGVGLVRDMLQNHILQLLALVAMEPPGSIAAERVRDEKVKVLECVRSFPEGGDLNDWMIRGQYSAGDYDGIPVCGYREEANVVPGSTTETFAAAKLMVDNWRWRGVPFYIRSGKRLRRRVTEIVIVFKPVPHSVFPAFQPDALTPNVLVFRVQPDEGGVLLLQAKRPGPTLCMGALPMTFTYQEAFGGGVPEAYERLLLDAMQGDQTLFIRNDTIDASWALLTPVLAAWEGEGNESRHPLHGYASGSWGPKAADDLLARDGRRWIVH